MSHVCILWRTWFMWLIKMLSSLACWPAMLYKKILCTRKFWTSPHLSVLTLMSTVAVSMKSVVWEMVKVLVKCVERAVVQPSPVHNELWERFDCAGGAMWIFCRAERPNFLSVIEMGLLRCHDTFSLILIRWGTLGKKSWTNKGSSANFRQNYLVTQKMPFGVRQRHPRAM